MADTRTKNTKRNIISGVGYRTVTVLLPFLTRTAILYLLGEQYVGLSSLFTSILQVLNLAELGFSSAIVYNMYKPVADGDDTTICALMNYYKHVYRVIGIIIFVSGIILLPFLPRLISGSWPNEINIYILYLLYLSNTALSYFLFAYKTALLNAMQRMDIVNVVQMISQTGKNVIQLITLLIFRNYYLFVIIAILTTCLSNVLTAIITDKKYPQYKCNGYISSLQKKRNTNTN